MDILIGGPLTNDQTIGIQDDDDAIGSNLSGLSERFQDFLNRTAISPAPNMPSSLQLDSGQLTFADNAEALITGAAFVTVNAAQTETVSDLFFSDGSGALLNGDKVLIDDDGDPTTDRVPLKTVSGSEIFLHSYDNGDIVLATTSATADAGDVVAAFYLKEAGDHKSASIEMVTFMAIAHPDSGDPDDPIDWTDLLNVSSKGSISFDFDNLESGNFLWAAVGNEAAGLLVTGQDLNVVDSGGKQGDIIKGGSSDPSDSVNTSQGGIGATIGINAQHFTDGPKVNQQDTDGSIAVFTLTTGFVPLPASGDGQATGINVKQIDYVNYINTSSVDVFISQTTGNADAKMKISLVNASFVPDASTPDPDDGTPEEGFAGVNPYIGNDTLDTALKNDSDVLVGSVTIGNFTWNWDDAGIVAGVTQGTGASAITVSIDGNDVIVDGVTTADTITVTARSGTFNRFDIQGLAGTADFDIGRIDIDNVTGDTAAVGGSLIVDDDGPKIGDSDGVSASIANSVVQLAADATGKVTDVTLGGAVGTDPKGAPVYTLTSYTSSLSINNIQLQAVPNSTTASLVTGVTYYEDTNKSGTYGDTGDDAFYRLTLGDSANNGAGGYTFEVLKVPAPDTLDFTFDNLESGNFLWVAVGNEAGGLLVTGQDLNVVDSGGKQGDIIKGGSSDPSDSVNTSQGGIGATIGINAQHFTDGPKVNQQDTDGSIAVFTLTTGFVPLPASGDGQATGINVKQIDYDNYLNTPSATLFISQTTGNADAIMKISLVNASFVPDASTPDPDDGTPEEGFAGVNPYIGNDTLDTALKNDSDVLVGSVTIGNFTWNWDDAGIVAGVTQGTGASAITVSIDGNDIVVTGATTGDAIEFTARSGTFNRFDLQALAGSADFDVGRVSLGFVLDTPDQTLNFTAKVTDGDGDAATDSWSIGIDGTGANDDAEVDGVNSLSSSLSSLSAKDPGFVDDSHMGDSMFLLQNHDYFMII